MLIGCSDERWGADTSVVDYEAEFIRLDQEVFRIAPAEALHEHSLLLEKYGLIYADYIEDVLHTGKADNAMTASLLMHFSTDPHWRGLQDHLERSFQNLEPFEDELEKAFKRYAVFFGESQLPMLVSYNSGYNVGVYPTDTWLGVGLEWFAGTDHRWVQQLPPTLFPQYKRDKMKPEYLVPNALRGWLLYRFRERLTDEEMLAEMVYAGKAAYLTQVLLQETDEQRIMNFTDAQMEWCREKEYEIWKNVVERDLVFSSDAMEINKMLNDGPFTPGLPQESPGGIGKWLGYRMVQHFMDRNSDVKLPELMQMNDNRRILKAYKPGR